MPSVEGTNFTWDSWLEVGGGPVHPCSNRCGWGEDGEAKREPSGRSCFSFILLMVASQTGWSQRLQSKVSYFLFTQKKLPALLCSALLSQVQSCSICLPVISCWGCCWWPGCLPAGTKGKVCCCELSFSWGGLGGAFKWLLEWLVALPLVHTARVRSSGDALQWQPRAGNVAGEGSRDFWYEYTWESKRLDKAQFFNC